LFTIAKTIRSDSMDVKASIYIPYAFQGFDVLDIKEFREAKTREVSKPLTGQNEGDKIGGGRYKVPGFRPRSTLLGAADISVNPEGKEL
jgi:hypothetical protein